MKLQARLLLVYLVLFAGAVGFLVLQRALDISRTQTLLSRDESQKHTEYQKLTSLEGEQLQRLSLDFSASDGLVTFVTSPTRAWATQDIDARLSPYNADAAWVYNSNQQLVYYSSATADSSATHINLPAAAFAKLNAQPLEQFYVQEPHGLMEVRAATIVPTSDQAHTTAPRGYWFVGRYINAAYVSKMADLTQSTITIRASSYPTKNVTTNSSIGFGVSLDSWDSQPLAVLQVSAQDPIVSQLEDLYGRGLLYLILLFVLFAVALAASYWWWVLEPVERIDAAILLQLPQLLTKTMASTSEFGELARTVDQFFKQKVTIQESEIVKSKLEELNKAKSEFLAIAAHELKGTVGNVDIFAGNLGDLIGMKASNDILKGEAERIGHQAHKALVLINDMYQAAKGDQGLVLANKEFDFDDFIRNEIEDVQYSVNQHINIEGKTHSQIITDPDRLGQVVSNLLRNAAKYSDPSTTINVKLTSSDNQVQVEVQDFGLGIDASDQEHLFERFYRSSRVTADYPGLGLGLSVCKDIIGALGGKIWLTSQLGSGSHFYFSLPTANPDKQHAKIVRLPATATAQAAAAAKPSEAVADAKIS